MCGVSDSRAMNVEPTQGVFMAMKEQRSNRDMMRYSINTTVTNMRRMKSV